MPLSPGGTDNNEFGSDDNEGPHCRNCHTGASSCNQCHGVNAAKSLAANGAFDVTLLQEGKTSFMPNAYEHTSAVADLSNQCIDGGFSFPHRTLGANMLKDEIYGIDYDGTEVFPGDTRSIPGAWTDGTYTTDWASDNYALGWYDSWTSENTTDAVRPDGIAIEDLAWVESGAQLGDGSSVENLDSVCIDCHGDSTYWNGDDSSYYEERLAGDHSVPGTMDSDSFGWDLLLKGLP